MRLMMLALLYLGLAMADPVERNVQADEWDLMSTPVADNENAHWEAMVDTTADDVLDDIPSQDETNKIFSVEEHDEKPSEVYNKLLSFEEDDEKPSDKDNKILSVEEEDKEKSGDEYDKVWIVEEDKEKSSDEERNVWNAGEDPQESHDEEGKIWNGEEDSEKSSDVVNKLLSVEENYEKSITEKRTPTCDMSCSRHWNPVCASNGFLYGNECQFNRANCLARGKLTIPTASWDVCLANLTCDASCGRNLDPICGSDGIMYDNLCLLKNARCKRRGWLSIDFEGCSIGCETKKGVPCVFPFTYKGVEYHSCTKEGSFWGRNWCKTADHWGYCDKKKCISKPMSHVIISEP